MVVTNTEEPPIPIINLPKHIIEYKLYTLPFLYYFLKKNLILNLDCLFKKT